MSTHRHIHAYTHIYTVCIRVDNWSISSDCVAATAPCACRRISVQYRKRLLYTSVGIPEIQAFLFWGWPILPLPVDSQTAGKLLNFSIYLFYSLSFFTLLFVLLLVFFFLFLLPTSLSHSVSTFLHTYCIYIDTHST